MSERRVGSASSAGAASGRPLRRRLAVAAPVLLASALLLPGLGHPMLWQDEAQTATIAVTILDHGVPLGTDGRNHFSQELGKEYDESGLWRWHTWLHFYVAAASLAILGESTFAARLPFALFAIATVALAVPCGRRLWRDPRAAVAGAAVLAVSAPFLVFGRQCRYFSMAAFFSLLGLHAYLRTGDGTRSGPAWLFAAAFLLFHTHYVYCATLLAALATHALLCDRPKLRPVLAVTAAVAVLNLPWIVWFSDVRPAGDAYLATVLDVGKWLRFALGYLEIVFTRLFDPRWLLVPAALAGWAAIRREPLTRPAPDTLRAAALLVLFVAANIALLAALSPLLFYRYMAPVVPALALLTGGLLGPLLRRSLVLGTVVGVAWVATTPLAATLHALRDDAPGPVSGIVSFLEAHASSDDVVAITYGDLPLKFYTDLRVVGGLTGQPSDELATADWVVIRRHVHTPTDRAVAERLRALIASDPGRWRRHRLGVPDRRFETREDPRLIGPHSPSPDVPRVIVYERRG